METFECLKNRVMRTFHLNDRPFTHQQHVKQEFPHEGLIHSLDLLDVVLDASPAQLNLHEEDFILFPSFVQRDAMFIAGELFVSLYFLESFAAMTLAPEDLLSFLDCVELSIVFAAHLEDLSETALAKLVDRFKALLEVRIVLIFVVETAGKRVNGRVSGLWRRCCDRRVHLVAERDCVDFVVAVADEAALFWE